MSTWKPNLSDASDHLLAYPFDHVPLHWDDVCEADQHPLIPPPRPKRSTLYCLPPVGTNVISVNLKDGQLHIPLHSIWPI